MASHSPYSRFLADDLTLRDLLAVDRTVVANERTLLGFIRTTLALVVTGASMLKFFDATYMHVGGILVCSSAVPLMAIGASHFLRKQKALRPLMSLPPKE